MKEIKIPIISGLSIAATLALLPIQVLAVNDTVATDESGNNVYVKGFSSGDPTIAQNYSGGFIGNVNGGSTSPSNHIVTIKGVNPGTPNSKDSTKFIVYGGGIGDGSRVTYPGGAFKFQQNQVAKNNKLVLQNKAYIWIGVGGEGKGAEGNSVSVTNSTVRGAVLGGNGTWYGKTATNGGDAKNNFVTLNAGSKILYQSYSGFNEVAAMGGRATGEFSAIGNHLDILGETQIGDPATHQGRIAGAAVENGAASGNYINITGKVILGASQELDGVKAAKTNTKTLSGNYITINNAEAKVQNAVGANATGEGNNIGGKATAIGNYVILQNGQAESTTGSYMAAESKNNYSRIIGGKVVGDVHGGFGGINTTHTAKSDGDHVEIQGGEIGGSAYGFRNINGDVKSSYVELSGGKVAKDAIGGLSTNGKISGTKVALNGGEVGNDVIGGSSVSGDVTGGRVEIANGATVGHDIIGGRSEKGKVEGGWVVADLTGKTVNQVIGGTNKIGSGSGQANNNRVQLTGDGVSSAVNGPALGGRGETGVSGNEFSATGIIFNDNVSGGTTSSGNATGNTLTLMNSKVKGNKQVKGGNAMKVNGSASGNRVNLWGHTTVTGDVFGAEAVGANSNNNTVHLSDSTVTGTIYGLYGTGSGSGNTLINASNASNPNHAGNIARFNVLNFQNISNANSDASKAALQITDGAQTDINHAKFQLNDHDYDVDTYAIGDGEKRYLIHNEAKFKNFDEKVKHTDNVFTIKNATTYSMNLKGLMEDDDGKSIVIQGKKKTNRTITDGTFDQSEFNKYKGPAGEDPTIDVGENPNAPENFGGLNIDTNAIPKATINLVSGDNIGTIKANDDDTINVGKDGNNPLVPGNITAKNIEKSGPGKLKMNFNLPNNYNEGNPAIKLTDNGLTDLTGTDVNVNNAKDGTTYTLVKKTNGGTINFNDRSVQKKPDLYYHRQRSLSV